MTGPERDSLSDRIVGLLGADRAAGMGRQELIEALGEDWTWEQISAALESLTRLRMVAPSVTRIVGQVTDTRWLLMVQLPRRNGPLRDAPAGE